VLSLGSVVAAMLLLERKWHAGATLAVPGLSLAVGALAAGAAAKLAPGRGAARRGVVLLAFLASGILVYIWSAHAAPPGLPLPALVRGVMAVGLVIGVLNGLLVAYGGLQPFIATLSTMTGVGGLVSLVTGEENARR